MVCKRYKSKNQTRINGIDLAREHIELLRLLTRIAKDLKILVHPNSVAHADAWVNYKL